MYVLFSEAWYYYDIKLTHFAEGGIFVFSCGHLP
jgi:hypothetical protein